MSGLSFELPYFKQVRDQVDPINNRLSLFQLSFFFFIFPSFFLNFKSSFYLWYILPVCGLLIIMDWKLMTESPESNSNPNEKKKPYIRSHSRSDDQSWHERVGTIGVVLTTHYSPPGITCEDQSRRVSDLRREGGRTLASPFHIILHFSPSPIPDLRSTNLAPAPPLGALIRA